MNRDEELAQKCLQSMGFQLVVYEPDGNIPPDFVVEKIVAVEVTRLNQNSKSASGSYRGLEEDSIPLWQKIDNLLKQFGSPVNGKSWFLGVDFVRPIPEWSLLKNRLLEFLNQVKLSQPEKLFRYPLMDNFELDIIQASSPLETMFAMGASSDGDSGGFILSEMEKNLKIILPKKYKKIEKHKSKYSQWWLLLPNYIGYGMSDRDREQWNQYIRLEYDWDRVVIFNPLNISNWMDI
jgi:hypothetical protein